MATYDDLKCPNCNAAIVFDPSSQLMTCPYCHTKFDVHSLRQRAEFRNSSGADDSFDWNSHGSSEWTNGQNDGMRLYHCQTCGGEIIGDANLVATMCPYCNNPVMPSENFAGILRPDLVIPFKLTSQQAKDAFKKHLARKLLLPRVFISHNHIDEVKGIYVPFWLFSGNANADINFNATKVRSWKSGNYDYTETKHYAAYRSGTVDFENIPADGSTKMSDDLMDSLEPYKLSEAVDFQTAYLSGFFADKYDVDVDEDIERINLRVKRSTEGAFAQTVKGYSSVAVEASSVKLLNGSTKYALLPVYILNTTWNTKQYTFAVNGQTGRFAGNLPVDKKRYHLFRLLFTIIYALIFFVIYYLIFK